MHAVTVSLPETAFGQTVEHCPDLAAIFNRIHLSKKSKASLLQLSHLLARDGKGIAALFERQSLKTMAEGKVHAEMQLIYHLETNGLTSPPRVIASSKMACFLCNFFLTRVSKMHTRRSHGRLYPAWKLPDIRPGHDLGARFVHLLEGYAKTSIQTFVSNQRKSMLPQPSESTLWTMRTSASTITVDGGVAGGVDHFESQASRDDVTQCANAVESEPSRMPDEPTTTEATVPKQEMPIMHRANQMNLEYGAGAIATMLQAGTTTPIMAGNLAVFVEYTVGLHHGGDGLCRQECRAEWLTQTDADTIRRCKSAVITDVDKLNGEISMSTDTSQLYYIASQGILLRLYLGYGCEH